jgi:hypothetical protein
MFNSLKPEALVNSIQNFSSYRTENIGLLFPNFKDKRVDYV